MSGCEKYNNDAIFYVNPAKASSFPEGAESGSTERLYTRDFFSYDIVRNIAYRMLRMNGIICLQLSSSKGEVIVAIILILIAKSSQIIRKKMLEKR